MNDIPAVSIFASAIRPRLWKDFFESLKSTSVPYEVVFAGPIDIANTTVPYLAIKGSNFKYIKTENIKCAQCYEIARRHCKGETISWIADDCEFSEDLYGKAYTFWKSLKNDTVALSIQVIEDGYKYNLKDHAFVGFDRSTPMMAPVCLMSRKVMDDLGGFDRRMVAGQYENSAIMDLYEADGCVIPFTEGQCIIDHQKKHGKEHSFRAGYTKDREVLEYIWGKRGELLYTGKAHKKEPYSEKDILVRSQSNNNPSIWV